MSAESATILRCGACDRALPWEHAGGCCPTCGALLTPIYPIDPRAALAAPPEPSHWARRTVLPPIPGAAIELTLGEGNTPILPLRLGDRRVLAKCEHLNPTGSYKDRGASVLLARARGLGIRHVVEDSSGNAGAAIAAYAARAGIAADIYVPESTSPGKTAQIERFGGRLVRVPGDRAATADAALAAAESAFHASHVRNPFFIHGVKTLAYELVADLGGRAPHTVVVPVGNGALILGLALGFSEMLRAGAISRRPRLVAVQSAACAPLAVAGAIEPSPTIAEGIAVAAPFLAPQIRAAIAESDGAVVTVADDQIRAARAALGRLGIDVEPTAAVAPAALLATDAATANRVAAPGAGPVAMVLTGHGLKSPG
jgi:threonine synthase